MIIEIKNLQTKILISPPSVKAVVRKILKKEGIAHACLSIAFVTSRKVKAINLKYLRHNYATDIITFDLREHKAPKIMNGEIIISAEMAAANAREFKVPIKKEISLCVIHGILHLLGYDDHSPAQIKKMRAKELELMRLQT